MVEEPRANRVSETETLYEPVTVFDGNCIEHYLTYTFTDPEGIAHARCGNCPMGALYDPTECKIIEGKIERILPLER